MKSNRRNILAYFYSFIIASAIAWGLGAFWYGTAVTAEWSPFGTWFLAGFAMVLAGFTIGFIKKG